MLKYQIFTNPTRKQLDLIEPLYKEFCKGNIGSDYGSIAMKRATHIITARSIISGTRKQPIKGGIAFIQIKTRPTKLLYLDIICAVQSGKQMMNFIHDFAKKQKCKYIVLYALKDTINFYRKLGYKHVKDCKTPEEKTITKKAQAQIHKRFKDDMDIIDDREYIDFLYYLINKGYSLKCINGIPQQIRKRAERNYQIKYKEVFKCTLDGILMMYCLHTIKKKPRVTTKRCSSIVNPQTNRCILRNGSTHKRLKLKKQIKGPTKRCASTINPLTNRCIRINGPTYNKLKKDKIL